MVESNSRNRMALTVLAAALAALLPGQTAAGTGAAPSSGAPIDAAAGILQRSFGADAGERILGRSARVPKPTPRMARGVRTDGAPREENETLDATRLGRTERYQKLIDTYSQRNRLEPALVKAIIYAESGGDTRALSPSGAAGLMQLMPTTARQFGVTDRYDPEQSIATGTRYLRSLLEEFGSPELALWAYNAGPTAVRAGRMPLETRAYVPLILRLRTAMSARASEGGNS